MGPLHPTRKKVSGGRTDIPYMEAVPPLLRRSPLSSPRAALRGSHKTDRNLSSVTFTRRGNRNPLPPYTYSGFVDVIIESVERCASSVPWRSRADPRLRRSLVAPCTLLLDRVSSPKGAPLDLLDSYCNSWLGWRCLGAASRTLAARASTRSILSQVSN